MVNSDYGEEEYETGLWNIRGGLIIYSSISLNSNILRWLYMT
jgi:hypothetical protein